MISSSKAQENILLMSERRRLAAIGAVRAFSRMRVLAIGSCDAANRLVSPDRQQISIDDALHLTLGTEILGVVSHERSRHSSEGIQLSCMDLTPLLGLPFLRRDTFEGVFDDPLCLVSSVR